jgi:uncharacterized membrane protein
MAVILRVLRLLAIVVWVGGLVFFAFVEAPTAFQIMGTSRDFALLIGHSLGQLNVIGHACGFAFLLGSIPLWFRTEPRGRSLLKVEVLLVVLMIIATMYVQTSVIPAMVRDRMAVGGEITDAPKDNPARVDFDRLHGISEKVGGVTLFLGLIVVVLMAAEPRPRGIRIVET